MGDQPPAPKAGTPHGHALVERLLPGIAARVSRGTVIEVGTTREKVPGQGSTVLLAAMAAKLGLPFVTVDMDPANTEQAKADLAPFPGAQAVTGKGEEYLAAFTKPVIAAYLDAFDIQHGKHSAYREARYRRFLGVEISNEAASEMHLACAEALVRRLVPGGLIVIDDTWLESGEYAGKGSSAVPALLRRGFTIVDQTETAIALQSPSGLPRLIRGVARRTRRAGRQGRRFARRFLRRARRALRRRLRGR